MIKDIDYQLDRSSFGDAEARRARARVSDEAAEAVVHRAAALAGGTLGAAAGSATYIQSSARTRQRPTRGDASDGQEHRERVSARSRDSSYANARTQRELRQARHREWPVHGSEERREALQGHQTGAVTRMRLTAALVSEQGVSFAVVVVKATAMQHHNREETALSMQSLFPGFLIILMSQDHSGRPNYYGRRDIVRFLSGIYVEQLPWKEYSVA